MANKTTIDVGVVTPVPKDEYSAAVAYERLNIVSFNGSSYMAKKNTTGHLPTDTTYWMLLAKKGDQGPDVAVVTQPIITGMNDVVAGSPSTYEVQSTSLLVGNSISRFDYRVGSGTVQSADAVNGRADIQVTVPSDVSAGTTVPLFVTAYDRDGHSNYNQKNLDVVTPVIAVPTVTGVISGSTNVGINPTITVSAFSVYPSGYDTAKQVRYKLFNGTTNLLVEESTREINSNGGSFTLNNLLSVNTKYRIEVWWEGNKISSDKYISTFTTLNAFITAPTITGVTNGQTGVILKPTFTVGAFSVTPTGFDAPANLTYTITKQSDGSTVETSTRNISASGGTFTPTDNLPLNTALTIKCKWVGNILTSPETVINFKTTNAFITAPTINTPLSESTDNSEVVTFDLSDFVVSPNGFDTHVSTTVEVYTDAGMTNLSATVTKTTGDLTLVDVGNHVVSTTYYARAKYSGSVLTSDWSAIRSYTTKDTFSQAYGVEWNPTTDTYSRTGLAVGTANSTSYAGAIQTQMKRCVLNANGTVKYYLHPNDSTKKADGTAATINGSDGNVMVEIPKFWYKYEHDAGVHKWSISPVYESGYEVHPAFIRGGVEKDYRYYPAYEGFNLGGKLISGSGRIPTVNQTRAQFRTLAAANGAGWSLIDWNLLIAVQLLYLTEYADFNSQAMIGRGNDTGSDYTMTTGGSNSIGNASSPSTNNDTWMSYRGIENWYASMFKFIDGVNVQERKYFINSNPATFADDVFTGDYINSGITSVATNGYVSNLVPNKKGFVASAVAGSDATFVPDYFYQSTGNKVVLFGGDAGDGLSAGGFYLRAVYGASGASGALGSGVSY